MQTTTILFAGAMCTVLISLVVVVYLRRHLHWILVDLCGTQERASFWEAFSNVTLVLVPTIFALHFVSSSDASAPVVRALSSQVEGALIGLVVAVLSLGFVIARFIPRGAAKI